ncbi:MAG: PAS domain-containing protein [Chloroflexi bacterium]|nr:PAS domain-containing protein [Chloroflexota bacterium]
MPLGVSILDFALPDLFGGLNPVPLALVVGVLALIWGIVRFRSGDIVPIARQLVIDSMPDAVLVFDTLLRLVDLNGTARSLLRTDHRDSIGRPLAEVFPEAIALVGSDKRPPGDGIVLVQRGAGAEQTLDIRISTLLDWRQTEIGSVIVVRDITEATLGAERLRSSLREKEVLLKEIHHRVKNNLQIISSLLSLQSSSMEDPRTLAQFQDSQNRIRSMALVHERLYRSENLARVEFDKYLHELVDSLVQTYNSRSKNITAKVDAEAVMLDIDIAIPCGLIVNELVSNALKHAFPNGLPGQIGVEMDQDRDDSRYRLVVFDNGVGMPENMDYRGTPSLGLKLVRSPTRQT